MEERNSNYEIKISRNGYPVPVINGSHLHSIFNPIKEAEAFGQNHIETIKAKNKYLFLGLGFGYHIDEFIKLAGQFHHEISILIIEPNAQLIEDYLSERGADKHGAIIHYANLKDYFLDQNLVEFLMLKPAIIKHDPTFDVEKAFFTNFLAYKPNPTMQSYIDILQEGEFKNYLKSAANVSYDQLVSNIKNAKQLNNKNDFLALALDQIVQTRI